MKKNDLENNFSEPTRQSAVAILLIILKTYRILVRQALPLILLFFVGKGFSGGKGRTILIGISVFAGLGMIYSIINYFRYYFYINNDELIIESGVFKRSKLNVPFDRIQTINFEQNIIHRVFNVVRLKIDTAGSAKAEFEFHAISYEKAESLRNLLLSKKKQVSKGNEPSLLIDGLEDEGSPAFKTIMQLDVKDLIKAGAVENHLRSGGIILAFMWWIWSSIDEMGMHEDIFNDKIEETVMSQVNSGLILIGIAIFIFFFLSFFISMIKMVITNYDLKFMRSENGFKINGGLFTKKDVSALDHKIQVVSWSDNPLKKLIGIKDLRLKQASSIVLNKKTSIKIPSCKDEHIELVKNTLYGKSALSGINYSPIDKRYFYRNGGIISLFFIGLVSLLLFLDQNTQAILFGALGALIVFSFYLSYRKKRYGFNKEMLVIRGGTYGDKTELLPIYKIQSLSKKQSPYQRRNGLANLVVHTASGKVGIPYIDNGIAQNIMDEFLYRIEIDKRKWM
ncbi:MAG: putative membrane protein [Saprospiraceae bacterium]|jgi:putative membrane protein|tara:strand:- start:1356 stop:2882 length:1527 start_codon:yes stop_codon:yes gene_type:complete